MKGKNDGKVRKGWMALTLSAALCASMTANAENVEVRKFKYVGPYSIATPWMVDSVDVKAQKYDAARLLDSPLVPDQLAGGKEASTLPIGDGDALYMASFTLTNDSRTNATISVGGLKNYRLFVDGNPLTVNGDSASTVLMPSCHTVAIKYLATKEDKSSAKVTVSTPDGKTIVLGAPSTSTRRAYNLLDVMCAPNYPSVELSPNGKYMIVRKTWMDHEGKNHSCQELRLAATGKLTATYDDNIRWMPHSNKFFFTEKTAEGKRNLVTIDPQSMDRNTLATNIPEGSFEFTPDEKTLVYTLETEGRKKDPQVYDIKSPDDRQPGWRNRSYLAKYDLATGILQQLSFGYHNIWLEDISADSRYLLVAKKEERLTDRPTTLTSLYRLDLQTLRAETLVEKDGFVNGAQFSPDGKTILVSGSPEAFDGIGKNVEEGQTPSMIDTQLYLLNIADKKVTPLTKDFNPNVQATSWSRVDGNIYLMAEDKDCVHIFRLNPKNGKFSLVNTPEEYIKSFSLASDAPEMAFTGQSASNADRLYRMNTRAMKSLLVDDLSARELKDIELGECKAWNYVNSRGDTLCCRYYLPPHFDATKQYPMVVNYYGGCSPTSRTFQSRYPHHVYAAMGYVVLVVNPSGATGFGQKFSARHVGTAGEGVAEDIIASTMAFCDEHNFVNRKKIGCIGASYGGFMTQYLQTKTDLFAAAISHAGISDHTSYWGEGYWGYSYSEVSMGKELPWTNKHLYVDQSPLYNADKIHTPLLFVHGTADHNVPVGESIQLYTALKRLGRPTAMVLVEDQDHHILDFEKRIKWQNTIFAWFAKWLQDDASWWKEMYGDDM